jgi:two-component system, cell cycle sensor histidine kinase and response regulator CckA
MQGEPGLGDQPLNSPTPARGESAIFTWKGSGEAILADDEPTVRSVAARALQRLGLTVTQCVDGREAVALVQADPARWRLVVLDLTMPVLAGDMALEQILSIRSDLGAIIYSGYSEDEMRGRFAGRPGVGFLQKPFTVRALSEAVASVLGPSA